MNSKHRSPLYGAPALVVAASLAFSPAAWSLGLGEVEVESYLNQPLRARIDLLTQDTDDLGSVTARLASAADYELIGASRESVSVPIRFTVEDVEGDAYILATSSLPVGDPVVRLIVEVNWSSGRMLREYTLFLDPPTVPAAAPAPRVDTRKPPPAAAPVEPSAPAPGTPVAPPPPSQPTPVAAADSEYGPVRSGETLWRIASDWSRGSGMDINRVMIAIQQQNPDAFLNGNINLLKRGAILRMPAMSDVESVSTAAAYREVAAQEEAFTANRSAPSVASPETPLLSGEAAGVERAAEPPPAADAESTQAGAGEDVAVDEDVDEAAPTADRDAETPAADESVVSRDVLELVPPSEEGGLDDAFGVEDADTVAGAEGDVRDLRESLARTEEELISQRQQNAYLEERIRELEAQVESADTDGVADADMANMEARLQAQRQAESRAQAAREPDPPWYTRWWVWLTGLLVVIAAFVGWLFSRRSEGIEAAAATAEDSLRDIKTEAEDVLRVLADEVDDADEDLDDAATAADEPGESTADDAEAAEAEATVRSFGGGDDDAELLDEESSDPEIQLDLARAYISMGDKEAARVILEEVITNGSEEQEEEARKMLDLLT